MRRGLERKGRNAIVRIGGNGGTYDDLSVIGGHGPGRDCLPPEADLAALRQSDKDDRRIGRPRT